MGRFRRSGTNWEGRKWYTSVGLNALMDEIEAAFPSPGPADGTVASKTHDSVSPSSDHRPYPYNASPAVVRAVDAGEYVENQASAIAEALRASRDSRIRYVIHEGQIFSSYATSTRKAWEWGEYGGASPHSDHIHVSLLAEGDTNGSPWNLGLEGEEVATLDAEDLANIKALLEAHDGIINYTNIAGVTKRMSSVTVNSVWHVDAFGRRAIDWLPDIGKALSAASDDDQVDVVELAIAIKADLGEEIARALGEKLISPA